MKLMKMIDLKKYFKPRFSTLRGITSDCNDENENTNDPLRFKCEFNSNEFESNKMDENELYGKNIFSRVFQHCRE
jgi:hypothetical protein